MMIMHYGSQLIIIIGAGIVSVLIGVGLPEIPKFNPAILSGVVAIVAAISNQFKFGERYRVRVLTAVSIEQESNWFDRKREPYKGLKPVDALNMFKEQIEGFIRAESESRLPPT